MTKGHQPANETTSLRFADKLHLGPDRTKSKEVSRGAKHVMWTGAKSCGVDTERRIFCVNMLNRCVCDPCDQGKREKRMMVTK